MVDTPDYLAFNKPERRRHVRVLDAVGLHIQRLEDIPAAGDGDAVPAQAFAPTTVRANKYEIDGYATVRGDHPAVAAYIDDLEERIRQLLLDGDTVPAVKPTHKVSLSAGGIYFADNVLLHPGELIGVTLTLFPSGRRIGTDARVVSANDSPGVATGDQLSYRVRFVRMADADRAVLVEHVNGLLDARPIVED